MVKKNFFIALGLSFSLVLSGCAVEPEPIDHQAQACSATNDILDAFTAVPAGDDFSDLEASNAILAATLAVWKSDGGATDPTFKLLSKYAGKLLLFLADGSPSSAKGLIDFEEKSGADILEKCGIYSVEYVNPLQIEAGCWNSSSVTAELQENLSGKWTRQRIVKSLTKTSYCSDDADYPWGIDFKVKRGFAAVTDVDPFDQEHRIVWTDTEGQSFSSGKYTQYSCEETSTSLDENLTLAGHCD